MFAIYFLHIVATLSHLKTHLGNLFKEVRRLSRSGSLEAASTQLPFLELPGFGVGEVKLKYYMREVPISSGPLLLNSNIFQSRRAVYCILLQQARN